MRVKLLPGGTDDGIVQVDDYDLFYTSIPTAKATNPAMPVRARRSCSFSGEAQAALRAPPTKAHRRATPTHLSAGPSADSGHDRDDVVPRHGAAEVRALSNRIEWNQTRGQSGGAKT